MEKDLVLCDTNVFIHFFNNNSETIKILKDIGHNSLLMSSITMMELYQGMSNKSELTNMMKKIKNYSILHFTKEVSLLATEYIKLYKLSHNLSIPDAIIAASSVNFNLTLFSYNIKDFDYIPDLRLYKIK